MKQKAKNRNMRNLKHHQCTPDSWPPNQFSIPILLPIPSIDSRFQSILLWNRFQNRNRRIEIEIGSTLNTTFVFVAGPKRLLGSATKIKLSTFRAETSSNIEK